MLQPGPSSPDDVTVLLHRMKAGDPAAAGGLMPLIYNELRAIANRHMRREREDHTLQATVLVHEAFLQLAGKGQLDYQDRGHFFAVASRAMRRVLIDYARSAKAEKRPGAHVQVDLDPALRIGEQPKDLLEVNEALDRLAVWDPRLAQVVEMRFFAGLTFEEIAEALNISLRAVKRDWTMARAWLHAELTTGSH